MHENIHTHKINKAPRPLPHTQLWSLFSEGGVTQEQVVPDCFPSGSRTPLHCAASCNSVHLCKQLVESGAAIFASTISDIETAADKCEEMEEGYIQCSQFLYGMYGGSVCPRRSPG